MPETRDIGRVYVHLQRYPLKGAPRLESATTAEIEEPYRTGRGVSIRLLPRWAVVIGLWSKPRKDWSGDEAEYCEQESEHLLIAVGGERLDFDIDTIREWYGKPTEEESSVGDSDEFAGFVVRPFHGTDGVAGEAVHRG